MSSGAVSAECFVEQLKGEEVFEQLAVPLASPPPVLLSSPRLQLLSACLQPSPWVPLPGPLFDLLYVQVSLIVATDQLEGYVVFAFGRVRVKDATDLLDCNMFCVFVLESYVMSSGFEEALIGIRCAAIVPVTPVVFSFLGVGEALSGPCPTGLGFAQSPWTRGSTLVFRPFRSFFVAAPVAACSCGGEITVLNAIKCKLLELAAEWSPGTLREITVTMHDVHKSLALVAGVAPGTFREIMVLMDGVCKTLEGAAGWVPGKVREIMVLCGHFEERNCSSV